MAAQEQTGLAPKPGALGQYQEVASLSMQESLDGLAELLALASSRSNTVMLHGFLWDDLYQLMRDGKITSLQRKTDAQNGSAYLVGDIELPEFKVTVFGEHVAPEEA